MIDQELKIRFKHGLLLTTFWFLIFSSCDDSFQPIKKNNQYNFNISGYLDVSADTQWIRVGTIRESIDEPPNPAGIQVTLEDLQSGKFVIMNDSVFTSKSVLNYWTTTDIEQGQSYRIIAESIDEKTSRVTVTTPKKVPQIYITTPRIPPGARIYIDDAVEHIADVQSVWYVIVNPGTENRKRIYRFPIRSTLEPTTAYFGAYSAFANHEEELNRIKQNVGNAEIQVVTRQFFLAVAGPEWNDSLSSIDDLEYFLEGTVTNVENGLGYVVGVDTKWYRQLTCLTPDSSNYAPCEPEDPFW